MKYISEITITGIIKEYVEDFGRRTERENKNLLHSILYKVENICFARIEELEEENAKLRCCGNCKHQRYDYESRYCEFDATGEKECVNLSEWELTK